MEEVLSEMLKEHNHFLMIESDNNQPTSQIIWYNMIFIAKYERVTQNVS